VVRYAEQVIQLVGNEFVDTFIELDEPAFYFCVSVYESYFFDSRVDIADSLAYKTTV